MRISTQFVSMRKERFMSVLPNVFIMYDNGFVLGLMWLYWGIGVIFSNEKDESKEFLGESVPDSNR